MIKQDQEQGIINHMNLTSNPGQKPLESENEMRNRRTRGNGKAKILGFSFPIPSLFSHYFVFLYSFIIFLSHTFVLLNFIYICLCLFFHKACYIAINMLLNYILNIESYPLVGSDPFLDHTFPLRGFWSSKAQETQSISMCILLTSL